MGKKNPSFTTRGSRIIAIIEIQQIKQVKNEQATIAYLQKAKYNHTTVETISKWIFVRLTFFPFLLPFSCGLIKRIKK